MKIGLVCISEVLKAKDKTKSFKTMTRKRFSELERSFAIKELSSRILHNCELTEQIIRHCASSGISHYRVSSCIAPLITDATLNLRMEDLPDFDAICRALLRAGQVAKLLNISVSSHPDQFNVLSSYSQETVKRSINELNHQAYILDLMGLPQNHSSPMCLHLNLSPDLKRETINQYVERFKHSFCQCSCSVRSRLVLENEDGGFWNAKNLFDCFSNFIPLVFDNLHDQCNPSDSCYISRFKSTWGIHTPIMHWSEGTKEKPRSHAEFASHLPQVVQNNLDCVWEFELKGKDKAIIKVLNNQYETV